MLSPEKLLIRKEKYLESVNIIESRGVPVKEHIWAGKGLSKDKISKFKPYRMQRLQHGSNRARVPLNPYGTKTGRNAPLASGNPLATGNKFRKKALEADSGHYIYEIDFKCQEAGIAAALSGDVRMMEDYQSGDFYQAVGHRMGLSKVLNRKLLKKSIIMAFYGASSKRISGELKISEARAAGLLKLLKDIFPKWAQWRVSIAERAIRDRVMSCNDWSWRLDKNTRINTLLAWMPQAIGAEIMRSVVIRCANIPIIGVIHDSFLIHSPAENARRDLAALQIAMRNASQRSLGGFALHLDTEPYPGSALKLEHLKS